MNLLKEEKDLLIKVLNHLKGDLNHGTKERIRKIISHDKSLELHVFLAIMSDTHYAMTFLDHKELAEELNQLIKKYENK